MSSQKINSVTCCVCCCFWYKHCAYRYRFAEDGSLHIASAQVTDTGRYLCMATNQAGIQRRRVDLQVYGRSHSGYTNTQKTQTEYYSFYLFPVPPSISDGRLDVTVTVNVQTTLSCEASGIPKPTVTWMKNGRVINTDQNQNMYRLI